MSKFWRVGDPFMKKSLTMPKNLKGDPLGFSNIAKQQKNEGETLWGKNFRKKSLTMPKKTERGSKGHPLISPGMVCYAGKQEKPFWFSSLGQMVQFGAIIFCRTFVELFWSLQVYRKETLTKSHDYSRLFSKEKRRLKTKAVEAMKM